MQARKYREGSRKSAPQGFEGWVGFDLTGKGKGFTSMRNDMKIRLKMASLRSGKITGLSQINGVCLKVVGVNTCQMKENLESWDEEFRF